MLSKPTSPVRQSATEPRSGRPDVVKPQIGRVYRLSLLTELDPDTLLPVLRRWSLHASRVNRVNTFAQHHLDTREYISICAGCEKEKDLIYGLYHKPVDRDIPAGEISDESVLQPSRLDVFRVFPNERCFRLIYTVTLVYRDSSSALAPIGLGGVNGAQQDYHKEYPLSATSFVSPGYYSVAIGSCRYTFQTSTEPHKVPSHQLTGVEWKQIPVHTSSISDPANLSRSSQLALATGHMARDWDELSHDLSQSHGNSLVTHPSAPVSSSSTSLSGGGSNSFNPAMPMCMCYDSLSRCVWGYHASSWVLSSWAVPQSPAPAPQVVTNFPANSVWAVCDSVLTELLRLSARYNPHTIRERYEKKNNNKTDSSSSKSSGAQEANEEEVKINSEETETDRSDIIRRPLVIEVTADTFRSLLLVVRLLAPLLSDSGLSILRSLTHSIYLSLSLYSTCSFF